MRKGFTGADLKRLAVFFMALDHIGAVVVQPLVVQTGGSTAPYSAEYIFYMVLRILGRFSFPMFCFLLVEGFFHTHNMVKYLRNLLLFAVVSEIPFNLALTGKVWNWKYQNVFFTLALGFIAIWITQAVREKYAMQTDKKQIMLCNVFTAAAMLGTAGIAELTHTDYGAMGVAVICILYAFRTQKTKSAVWAWAVLTLDNTLEFFSFPFIFAVKAYNGERGKQNKYFFYVFYPVHLLVLYGIKCCIY